MILIYAIVCRKRFPANMADLFVVPDGFGAADDARIDVSVTELSEVVDIRVVHKDDDIILRIRDNCVSFDPLARASILEQAAGDHITDHERFDQGYGCQYVTKKKLA